MYDKNQLNKEENASLFKSRIFVVNDFSFERARLLTSAFLEGKMSILSQEPTVK